MSAGFPVSENEINTSEGIPPSHGCDIEIYSTVSFIWHGCKHGPPTRPTVRSYPDGIKVGCTFVTTDALRRIYTWHEQYISYKKCLTHQS